MFKGEYEPVKGLTKLMYFGERAVILNEAQTATAIAALPNTQCWFISAADFR